MQYKTLIVEDEPHSRARLMTLLEAHTEIDVVDVAQDGPDAVQKIDSLKPDLVFLDVQLPGFSGIEVLEKINHRPMVIFVTAFDEYAIKAFDENAIDYLLKPTTPERLSAAIAKVVNQSSPAIDVDFIRLFKNSIEAKNYLSRFTIKIGDEILLVPVNDVWWIHAEDKYVFVNTFNKSYIVNETLKNLETLLDPASFIRIHKSVIIHVKKIRRIKREFIGGYKIYLDDEKKSGFEVGRTYLALVRTTLNF